MVIGVRLRGQRSRCRVCVSNFYPFSPEDPEMAQRKTGNVRLAPDGNMMRDASSPGGTLVGTQTYGDTPEKKNKAWLFNIQEDARAAAGHRKLNSQAVKNARKKAKLEEKTGEPARESLALRALHAGIHLGPLGVGPERAKKQKIQSQEVCRAEQAAQKRDARNAWQKAYNQVPLHSSCTQEPELITHLHL